MGFLRRSLDQLHYLLTLARLRWVDALYGPEPETEADKARNPEQAPLRKSFPGADPTGS
jgi:hypothetical protein